MKKPVSNDSRRTQVWCIPSVRPSACSLFQPWVSAFSPNALGFNAYVLQQLIDLLIENIPQHSSTQGQTPWAFSALPEEQARALHVHEGVMFMCLSDGGDAPLGDDHMEAHTTGRRDKPGRGFCQMQDHTGNCWQTLTQAQTHTYSRTCTPTHRCCIMCRGV